MRIVKIAGLLVFTADVCLFVISGELHSVVQMWWQGQTVAGLVWFHHKMLFWGRWGKSFEFAAGLVVIFDLIGPEWFTDKRNEIASRRLKVAKVSNEWRLRLAPLRRAPKVLLDVGDPKDPSVELKKAHDGGDLPWWLWLLMAVIGVSIVLSILKFSDGWQLLAGFYFWKLLVLAMAVVLFVIYQLLSRVLLVFQIFLGFAAFILSADRQSRPLRWAAFGLFIIGFQFDLLAS